MPKYPAARWPQKWDKHKFDMKLVNPANKRKFDIIVVGSGLAGASAAASLAELGYKVKCFCFQDSPRRAHSIAAQGGINAAKNYQNDGDSVYRLFYDTIKGGDFRSREANVYRLAQVSVNIIDQCVAQGVPFAREYGGLLANRSFGGAQVSRTFYARGQTGQQLLLGAYQALVPADRLGKVEMYPAHGNAGPGGRRWPREGHRGARSGHRQNLNPTPAMRWCWHRRLRQRLLSSPPTPRAATSRPPGAPTRRARSSPTPATRRFIRPASRSAASISPSSRSCPSRCATTAASGCPSARRIATSRPGADSRSGPRLLSRTQISRAYGNLAPRDISSRAAKEACDEGRGVGPGGLGVYLDFADAIKRLGEAVIRERYGNLFDMYERITGENPYQVPMRIYPAVHYAMGGTVGGLQFDDQPAGPVRPRRSQLLRPRRQPPRRQRPDAGPGRRLFRAALHHRQLLRHVQAAEAVRQPRRNSRKPRPRSRHARSACCRSRASAPSTSFHRELGKLLWEKCGMARNEAGLKEALKRIPELREEFWKNVNVTGEGGELNQSLEYAGRVADFMEFAELLCLDALASPRILRRPFPRGIPDARRRGAARRRELLPMWPPGNTRARTNRRFCTRNRSSMKKFT